MNIERFFSIGLLIFSIIMCYLAFSFDSIISYDPVGAKAFPILIFSLLIISLTSLVFRRNDYYELLNATPNIIKKTLVLIIAFFSYSYLFEIASYPFASAFIIFVVGKVFKGKTIPCIITAITMSIGAYILFDTLLDVPLPLGLFQQY